MSGLKVKSGEKPTAQNRARFGRVLHSHHPPSSLFVDLQTRCAGRVLDWAMMASGKLAPEC